MSATMEQVVRAFRRGADELRHGYLNAGRLAHELVMYLVYVTKTHTREAAIGDIRDRLSSEAGRTVDVNAMIATWQATRLLHADGDPCETTLPYSTLEELRVLVERDKETNEWRLKPATAKRAKTLYFEASTVPPMTLAKVAERVAAIGWTRRVISHREPELVRPDSILQLGTAEETGRRAADFVLGHSNPMKCLESFLQQLKARKLELDTTACRAVDTALAMLSRTMAI